MQAADAIRAGLTSEERLLIGAAARDALVRAIATRAGRGALEGDGVSVPEDPPLGAGVNLSREPTDPGAMLEAITRAQAGGAAAPTFEVGGALVTSSAHLHRWLRRTEELEQAVDLLAAVLVDLVGEDELVALAADLAPA